MVQEMVIPTEVMVGVVTFLVSLYAVGRMQEHRVGVTDAHVIEWANIFNVVSIVVPLHAMVLVLYMARWLGIPAVVAYDGFTIGVYIVSVVFAILVNTIVTIIGLKFGDFVSNLSEIVD